MSGEDLSTLKIAELRARAKKLGLDMTSRKKADFIREIKKATKPKKKVTTMRKAPTKKSTTLKTANKVIWIVTEVHASFEGILYLSDKTEVFETRKAALAYIEETIHRLFFDEDNQEEEEDLTKQLEALKKSSAEGSISRHDEDREFSYSMIKYEVSCK